MSSDFTQPGAGEKSEGYVSADYRIVYVASLTHSGSTLLDLLISGHSQAFSVGEVFQLEDYARLRREKTERTPLGNECTCGAETIWACDFWPRVDARIRARSGLGLRDLAIQSPDAATFRDHNKLLFDAVAQVSGARVIVDSSKLQSRLAALLASEIAPIVPVHLRRDPRGQVNSVVRRTGQSVVRPALRYCLETTKTCLLLQNRPHVDLAYEGLVSDPETELRRVMAAAGLDFEPQQLEWSHPVRHNLSGNLMRKSSDSHVRADETWRRELNMGQKTAIATLTSPSLLLARALDRYSSGGRLPQTAPRARA